MHPKARHTLPAKNQSTATRMDLQNLGDEIRRHFGERILSTDTAEQAESVEAIYDAECILTNPYLTLNGRSEISQSYYALARNNASIVAVIESVSFDSSKLLCMADVQQTLRPKTLGKLLSCSFI